MPRFSVRYQRQRDPAEEARKQQASQLAQQRQAQASNYAAARFQEWAAGAQDRQALLNARLQQAQAQAEMAGAQFRYNMWKDNELRNQTTHYYNAMPVFQETLKQAGIVPGTDRYRAEMAAFAATIPDALTHNEAIRKELADFSKVDATQEQISGRLKTVKAALEENKLKSSSYDVTASGQIGVKSTRPIDEGLKAVGLTPDQFLNHVNAKQGTFDKDGNFTDKLTPGQQADAIQFQAGQQKDDRSKLVKHSMPLTQFNQYRSDLGLEPQPAYVAPNQGNTSPSPTPSSTPGQTPIPSPTQAGIEVGAQRTINGQLAEWDGQGWSAVQQ